ncbi:MAG: hypothetical protein E4H40_01935 [Candidatus Brocadiia bacterium]|nr:MAG: hypothetical protein E4H40_01935 [Candidatus Brocadiia bacterium]
MTKASGKFTKIFNPFWLTGPVFEKELLVSSRRKRNYVLRFLYLIFLSVFIMLVWVSSVKFQGAAAFQKSRMSEAGNIITSTIVIFQFIATQLIAIIMLSNSISDEIYHRTLGTLMTTPISSFQIVMGKLLSKILQLVLLMGISLPILAIIRVFGGVAWEYIISSLFITFTAVFFAGALSLFFSISSRRAFAVIIKTSFTLGVIYLFLPAIIDVLLNFRSFMFVGIMTGNTIGSAAVLFNPFMMLHYETVMMLSPPGAAGMSLWTYWPLHCFVMLILTAIILWMSVKTVRRVALDQACGRLDLATRIGQKLSRKKNRSEETNGKIRPVKGRPVLWKELRAPIIKGRDSTNSIIGFAAAMIALFITYISCSRMRILDYSATHESYIILFEILGGIFTLVLSAVSITSEKESGAWPILLATSMDDWQILTGKGMAVIRKTLPIWLFIFLHLILFVMLRAIHPIAIVQMLMVSAGTAVFLCSIGLYFSSLFRRTTAAVIAAFGFIFLIWAVIPMLLGYTAVITEDAGIVSGYSYFHPLVQSVVIIEGTTGYSKARESLSGLVYFWPENNQAGTGRTTLILSMNMLVYVSAGVFSAWRAKCRFRRKIF